MPISREYLGTARPPAGIKDFYFIRHGTTDLNEKEMVLQGEKHWGVQGAGTNIGLNAAGERQAFLAGNVLRALPISDVVCSPLIRALQTAFLANIRCSHFKIDDSLQERDFGKHEGKHGPLKMFEDNYPDCEDTEIFSLRIAKALNHARSENTLLVSHGGVLRVIALLLEVDLSKEHTDNGRVLHFTRGVSNWTLRVHRSSVILISRPTSRISKSIAEDLIGHGYRLSLGARIVKDLEDAFGPQNEWLHYSHFDAEEHDTMKAWVNATIEKFGRIDGLVNKADYDEPVNLEKDIDYELLQKRWYSNCVAPLRMTELCLPYLIEAGSGRIVNVKYMSAQGVLNPLLGYNVTKHNLGGRIKLIQHVGWDHGVQVVDICLSPVATGNHTWADPIANKDMVQPEDIAKLVRDAVK